MWTTIDVGKHIEDLAKHYIMRQNLQIVCSNFCCRVGEIDLIALSSNCLIFIEVRYRRSASYGGAVESVSYVKQRKMVRAAQFFLQRHAEYGGMECRFDVLAMSGNLGSEKIEWIKGAFDE